MNYQDITHIERRMQEMGHSGAHLQPIAIELESGTNKQQVNFCNEFVYLLNESIPEDIIIHSDSELFCSSIHSNLPQLPTEFSGMTYIESSTEEPFTLQFIRAIPQ